MGVIEAPPKLDMALTRRMGMAGALRMALRGAEPSRIREANRILAVAGPGAAVVSSVRILFEQQQPPPELQPKDLPEKDMPEHLPKDRPKDLPEHLREHLPKVAALGGGCVRRVAGHRK
jgi:hypothetical protein